MIVIKRETKKIVGKQSIVQNGSNFYLVSSVSNPAVDKTFIVKCSEKGKVKDWNEVYTVKPSNHIGTLEALENGVLNESDFSFVDGVEG